MPKVVIDGQQWNLSDGVLQGMLEAIETTVKQGVEAGFSFCDTGTEIVPGPMCKGSKQCIAIKDCAGKGHWAGDFHSHPQVISFSQSDYLHAMQRAYQHPQQRSLLCVGLLDAEVRCKSLKSLPPKEELAKVSVLDTEKNREKVKPFWTKKVAIPLTHIAALLAGTPWEQLPVATPTVAIDEGEGLVVIPTPVCIGAEPAGGGGLHQFMASGQGVGAFIQSRMGFPTTVKVCGDTHASESQMRRILTDAEIDARLATVGWHREAFGIGFIIRDDQGNPTHYEPDRPGLEAMVLTDAEIKALQKPFLPHRQGKS